MTHEERPLSTADLAQSAEARGRSDEQMIGREAFDEAAPNKPLSAEPHTAAFRAERDATSDQPRTSRSEPGDSPAPLFAEHDASDLRKRWTEVQTGFVDEPRKAVEEADSLVADVMKRLAEGFAHERASLEGQWSRGNDVTTEDLRIVMRRYRSFFDRLLAM